MRRRLLSLGLGVVIGASSLAGSGAAAADESARAKAREAYDRGASAHAHGDEATAARELALADALVPSPVTLSAALEAAIAADDAVLAITLCDRSARSATDASLTALVQRARARFGRRVGRLRLTCPGTCSAKIDDATIETDTTVVLAVGHHAVVLEYDGHREERAVDIEPEVSVQLAPHPAVPEAPPVAPRPPAKRISSPAWFIAAASITTVSAGVSIGFGVDASNRYTAFTAAGCTSPKHGDCTGLVSSGQAAALRTNILFATSGVLAAGTTLIGFLTFRAPEGVTVAIGAGPNVALRVPLQ